MSKVLVLVVATAATATAVFTPTTDENMNGEYIISKTPNAPGNFSTNYKDYPGLFHCVCFGIYLRHFNPSLAPRLKMVYYMLSHRRSSTSRILSLLTTWLYLGASLPRWCRVL